MINLQKAISARRLKQAEAANLLGVTQPRVSDLMRGRIDLFSTDTLIDMLARLGIRVKQKKGSSPSRGASFEGSSATTRGMRRASNNVFRRLSMSPP